MARYSTAQVRRASVRWRTVCKCRYQTEAARAGSEVISSSLERARRRLPGFRVFADPAALEVPPLPSGARQLRVAPLRNYCVIGGPCEAVGPS
jgi:hypothetical protein